MNASALQAISPIDGRYSDKTQALVPYFSEFALIRYRVLVEVEYFKAMVQLPLEQLSQFGADELAKLDEIYRSFDQGAAVRVKLIERTTNHDVKAVEYYLKSKFDEAGLSAFKEFIHFGLTSQDVNNVAVPYSIKLFVEEVYFPMFEKLQSTLRRQSEHWKNIPMLARTHGQPASPTRLGKEWEVFASRLAEQKQFLNLLPFAAKFGGATGNFNAHFAAYPAIDWHAFANFFLRKRFGLKRSFPTTQIEHYDHLAALFHAFARINTILIDFCRDAWAYISLEYFTQKTVSTEIGSSAMPHKVNPIDFENAEGNLGIANAIFYHFSEKLPVSRLQRDLTDSTVLRNVGVPFGHTLLAIQSILKGLDKLVLNETKIRADLEANWMVVAEGIQTILRREGYPEPYEALKALTRGRPSVTQADMVQFIEGLDVSSQVKQELLSLSPWGYTGR